MKAIALLLMAGLTLSACASLRIYDPEQHLSAEDHHMLSQALKGDSEAIHLLFLRSVDKDLDSDANSRYSLVLWDFLDGVGQDKFFAAWEKEQPPVRNAVAAYFDAEMRTDPD